MAISIVSTVNEKVDILAKSSVFFLG